MAKLGLLAVDNLAAMVLGAVVLPRHPAVKAFRRPITRLQNRDDSAATLRAQKFPSKRSLGVAISNSASANSFLSLTFSFSS